MQLISLKGLAEIEKEASNHADSTYRFIVGDIADKDTITNPDAYIQSNLMGSYNILEACRHSYDEAGDSADYQGVQHLVYASSSSVYGSNKKVPYSTEDKVDNPVSLHAATKKQMN